MRYFHHHYHHLYYAVGMEDEVFSKANKYLLEQLIYSRFVSQQKITQTASSLSNSVSVLQYAGVMRCGAVCKLSLYCTLLYRVVLYCVALCCIVLYRVVL